MKGLLGFLKQSTPTDADKHGPVTFHFSTAFVEEGIDPSLLVP